MKKKLGLIKLTYSTKFWLCMLGATVIYFIYKATKSPELCTIIASLFLGAIAGKAAEDYGYARSLGGTNPPKDKDEK